MTTNILVLGAGGPAGFNFIDSLKLSHNDYHIVGADTNPYHLQQSNADEKVLLQKTKSSPYISNINEIIEEFEIDFLHAQPDEEITSLTMTQSVRDLIKTKTLFPGNNTIAVCQDKMLTRGELYAQRVRVPKCERIFNLSDLRDFIEEYGKSWLRVRWGAGSKAALPVTNVLQAQGWMDYWIERGYEQDDFIISEFLPGREFAWQSVWYEGELVTSQARERLEYLYGNWMPSGQSSSPSVARTTSDDRIYELGEAAVRAVCPRNEPPHGIFCVDMKENEAGRPCVTEVNAGRFFTTSNFFSHAGLNMPDIYVQLGLGTFQDSPGTTDQLPDNLYWLRQTDMGHTLVDGDDLDSYNKIRSR